MPTISVILPIYNVEAYLPACLESLAAQTFADFEAILVDDGSPDGCAALCDSWAARDARFRVLHQKNGGLSAARNAGMALARGEYWAFVDSDDLLLPTFLERLYAAMVPGVDLALCGVEDVTENGSSQSPRVLSLPREGVFAGRELLNAFYGPAGAAYTVAWNKLYRAELFLHLRYPEGKLHEDDAVAAQLFWACGQVACLAEPLYHYRLRPGSILRAQFRPALFDGVDALAGRCLFLQEQNAPAALCTPALAACFRQYLSLCGQARAAGSSPALCARLGRAQQLLRPLLGQLPGCRALSAGEKLHAVRWVLTAPDRLL